MHKEIVRDQFFLMQKCLPCPASEREALARDLADTLALHRHECVGLAANMIGSRYRAIIVLAPAGDLIMFDPVIVSGTDPFISEEGCLSLAGTRKTERYGSIEVSYTDRKGRARRSSFSGMCAVIIQHETDHLNGILI